MTDSCRDPSSAAYQVADPRTGHALCSHPTAEDAIACAGSSNRLRPLKTGERAGDHLLFVRLALTAQCNACGRAKAA